uniref:Uncharacterized protein n=1 Tax=Rhizophora mucronata TaxID=61149 RepID=A0A2P2IXC0_RHIMU
MTNECEENDRQTRVKDINEKFQASLINMPSQTRNPPHKV